MDRKTNRKASMAPVERNMKKRRKLPVILAVIAVVAIALTVTGIVVFSGSGARRLRQQLDLGNRYLTGLQYTEAIAAFEEALEIDPKSAEAYTGLISAHLGAGDTEGASAAYARAMEHLTGVEISGLDQILTASPYSEASVVQVISDGRARAGTGSRNATETGSSTETGAGFFSAENTAAPPQNTNLVSSLGMFLYHDGYTYFWTEGYDNDASGNGDDASVNLYRISEEADAVAERLAVLPGPDMPGDVSTDTPIYLLAGYEDRIYYTRFSGSGQQDDYLSWISTDGSAQGDVAPYARRYGVSGNHIVFYEAVKTEAPTGEEAAGAMGIALRDYNMSDDTLQPFELKTPDSLPVFLADGYAYLVRAEINERGEPVMEEIDTLYREHMDTGECEEVCSLEEGFAGTLTTMGRVGTAYVTYFNRFLYLVAQTREGGDLYALSLSDGSYFKVLESAIGMDDSDVYFNVTPEAVYYTDPETGSLCICNPDGTDPQTLIPASGEGVAIRLALTDRWIYYILKENGEHTVCRVDRNAQSFTHEPIAPSDAY